MHYDQIKSLQIALLTFASRYTQGIAVPFCFLLLTPLALVTREHFYLNAVISVSTSLLAYFSCMKEWMLAVVLVNLWLCYCLRGKNRDGEKSAIKLIFLVCLGLTSMNPLYVIKALQLFMFYLVLILEYLELQRAFLTIVKIYRLILPVGLVWLASGHFFIGEEWSQSHHTGISNQTWWYYLSFTMGTFYASLLSETGKVVNLDEFLEQSKKDIEMRDISEFKAKEEEKLPEVRKEASVQHSLEQGQEKGRGIMKSVKKEYESQRQKQVHFVQEQPIEIKIFEPQQTKQKLEVKAEDVRQSLKKDLLGSMHFGSEADSKAQVRSEFRQSRSNDRQQGQNLNLLLIIPFCLFEETLLQLPLYAYILTLQWNKPHKIIAICMLISAGFITLLGNLNTNQGIIARVLGALLVAKQLQGGQILGEMLRSFWLRTSFGVVLAILFWFSLLTVNIFHLLFIIVVLLFVIKNQRVDRHSYRHRNWKYLQFLFNVFLLSRLVYELCRYYGLNPSSFNGLLEITGISYAYTSNLPDFNLIPLLINAAIGLQYLTYHSAIYATQSRQPFLMVYQGFLQRFGRLLTIIYYKLIPWASYIVELGLLVSLDFSLSSWVLLGWGVLTIGVHVLSRHDLASYRRMNLLWLGFMRLMSLQIVLRFAFQFAKFDLLSFLKGIPFFDTLLRYEQLLGLAIPKQDVIYLKTVTRFQLMVSLDLAAIFVAFLVQDYYLLLIKYLELPSEEERQTEDLKIIETYNQYIDFKIVNWLSGFSVYRLLRVGCNLYLQLYFPLIGLVACLQNSILMGLYLLIGLRYCLILNLRYYQSHVEHNLMLKVMTAVIRWRRNILGRFVDEVRSKFDQARKWMESNKIKGHDNLRFWMVLVTSLSILLVHFSKALQKKDVVQILGQDLTLTLRWWLYVSGCSIELGMIAHYSKLILLLIVIERKCSWFMGRLYAVQQQSPQLQQDRQTHQVLMQQQQPQGIVEFQVREPTSHDEDDQESHALSQLQGNRQHEVVEMRVSLLLGCVKLLERSLVMVLVFASLVEMSHPFGVVYLLCAILLNYLGSLSIKTLSRILFVLIISEYFLLLANYYNHQLLHNIPEAFRQFQDRTLLDRWLHLPKEWEDYITFGKSVRELAVLMVSWLLIVIYPIYFRVLRWAGKGVLELLQKEIEIGPIAQRLIDHIQQVYSYGLSYSPLIIMLLCLWIYFLDYTVTNLFLTVLTIGFVFISFFVRDYKDSRQFWRTYFIVLQLMIVFFMLVFSLLQLPMLAKYCNKVLCAPQQLHTQFSKALLLLILQLGLDLTHSHHFDRALAKLAHSKRRTNLQRIAIAQRHNDRKILQQFKRIRREKEVEKTVEEVQQFLKQHKANPLLSFGWRGQDYASKQTWMDLILDFLPEIVDQYLLLSQNETRRLVLQQNQSWMDLRDIAPEELAQINDSYIDYFAEFDTDTLIFELHGLIKLVDRVPALQASPRERQLDMLHDEIAEKMSSRKSFINEELPMESKEVIENIKIEAGLGKEKQQLLYLLLVQSVFSNWHLLTYFVLILVHIRNLGLLTFPIPLVIFCCGLVSSERTGKQVWRSLLILVVIPLLFKFCLGTGLIACSDELIFLLVGSNLQSAFLEYLSIIFIIGECVILKLMGHWQQTTQEIECMRMALIRNIINTKHPEERDQLFEMLRQSEHIPTSFTDATFGRSQLKAGYDYSTVLTALQLMLLIWVFLFYDRMAVRQEITFYRMIQYNQFSSGMVVLTLIQLVFLLLERFIAIADLREWSDRWEVALILKYLLLVANLIMTESVVLLYFPLSSERYQSNTYITVMVIVSMMGLLVQALQIKKGLDRASRGFMDRYTWYNGFIYMGYRAIPFLFEFKMFSDWTFTKTALRIFDWIRLEEIFGRLYVAKCNALFLAGKTLGSKQQWWKKLLMGYPLLLSIILLLFGPLVLFSGLNPLASLNDVTAGYLQIVLRVNRTNQYPLYTNSHITDIYHLQLSEKDEQLLSSYDIETQTVQLLHLQEFSDQYWEISEGSYHKLLVQPEGSLYELAVRARFDRNQTGLTLLYVLSSVVIQTERVLELKHVLAGNGSFCVDDLINPWMRLDNNNGLHLLGDERQRGCLHAQAGVRASKQYWVVEGGLRLRIASDKYTQAIFGYSVMSFYISIILVIANYFRFLFQGSVHNIIFNDIPHPDPLLALTNAVFKARRNRDLQREEELFWLMIDLLRSPDTLKALTGDYLQARLDTLKEKQQ